MDSFRLGPVKGMEKAAELGADSFQVHVAKGPMGVETMTAAGAREFVKLYRKAGLELSATCADFSINYGDAEKAPRGVALLQKAVEQAVELKTDIVTTHIGKLPETDEAEAGQAEETMIRHLNEAGKYAERHGVRLATETGPEDGRRLAGLLERLDTAGVRVNFDPANLVMKKFDHLQCLRDLTEFVVHTHAKDARRGNGEVPLGEGDVDFPAYLQLLVGELGYRGALTIEREVGDDPVGDVAAAIAFLRSLEDTL